MELIEHQADNFKIKIERSQHRQKERQGTVNPTYDLAGQVALVTGGSSGMGLATARAFAEAEAAVAVVIADVNETTLGTATDELVAAGHRALGVPCDVSEENSVAMVKGVHET